MILEKPAQLIVNEEEHTYRVGQLEYPSVTTILRSLDLSRAYRGVSDYYRDRGRAVHKAVELVDKGTLDEETLHETLIPYVGAYRCFVKDSGYQALCWELALYDEKVGFAGTLDKVGRLNGRLGILDIKAASSIDPAAGLQLKGYEHLWNLWNEESPCQFRYVLQLTSDGKYQLVTKFKDDVTIPWSSVMDVYLWKTRFAKRNETKDRDESRIEVG